MLFIAGPRQVGKTTCARNAMPDAFYLSWDNLDHRSLILKGPSAVHDAAGGRTLQAGKRAIIFDELHKFARWKNYLKGFYDTYQETFNICVTGSARLSVYRQGGDSMMGRYFLYRMHPLSVGELLRPVPPETDFTPPLEPVKADFDKLLRYGGFPEPFLRGETRFHNQWKRLRSDSLFNEDVRDLSLVTDVARLRVLGERLREMAGGALNYSHLAGDLQVSVDTIRRWLDILEALFYCFRVYPYSKRITRSLLREPKIYLWDWSLVTGEGERFENVLASHLLKGAHLYTDMGLGDYRLHYLRDKEQREVDFLMTRDGKPWFLAEAKVSEKSVSKALYYFQSKIDPPHALQVVLNMPFVDADCFREKGPIVVPAMTFLSQLP